VLGFVRFRKAEDNLVILLPHLAGDEFLKGNGQAEVGWIPSGLAKLCFDGLIYQIAYLAVRLSFDIIGLVPALQFSDQALGNLQGELKLAGRGIDLYPAWGLQRIAQCAIKEVDGVHVGQVDGFVTDSRGHRYALIIIVDGFTKKLR